MSLATRSEDPIRTIIYARMSTEGQDSELSIGAQLQQCRKFAGSRGYEIAGEFTDVASGGSDQRPGFQHAMEMALDKQNRIGSVLVYDLSRFTRNPEDFFDYYGNLKRAGVSLDSYLEPHRGDEMSELFYSMITIFNSVLLPRIARYTRRGQFKAIENGYYISTKPPFGYQKYYVEVGDKKHAKLESCPDTWDQARRVFDLLLEGYAGGHAAEILTKEGIRTASGREFSSEAVLDMARNEAYLGHAVRGKQASSKYLDNSERARCENAHEPMVTQEEYDRIQELISGRTFAVASPRSHRSPSIFSGRVFCKRCGNGMTVHKNNNGSSTLICSKKRKQTAKACSNENANLSALQEAVIGDLLDRILTPSFIRKQVEIVAEKSKELVKQEERRAKSITNRISSIKTKKANLLEQIESFGPQKDTKDRLEELAGEQTQLETELAIQEERGRSRAIFVKEPDRIIANAMDKRTYLETKDPQKIKQLMNIFVRKLTIYGKIVTIEYEIPVPPGDGGDPVESKTIPFDPSICLSEGSTGIHPLLSCTLYVWHWFPRPRGDRPLLRPEFRISVEVPPPPRHLATGPLPETARVPIGGRPPTRLQHQGVTPI